MLHNRNVMLSGRRTCVRLESAMWEAVTEIAMREGRTIHEICSMVDRSRQGSTFTLGLRTFILSYFRGAATPEGHRLAGHGSDGAGVTRATLQVVR